MLNIITPMDYYFQPPKQILLNNQTYTHQSIQSIYGRCGNINIYQSNTGQLVCMKFLNPNKINNFNSSGGYLQNEIIMLQKFQGPNIIQFVGSSKVTFGQNAQALCLFTKFYKHGSFQSLLEQYGHELIESEVVIRILLQLYYGMNQLWSSGYAHGDFKFTNTLVDSICDSQSINTIIKSARILISDFESVRPIGTQYTMHTRGLKPDNAQYMSAECDIYAIGVCIEQTLLKYIKNPDIKKQLKILVEKCKCLIQPSQLLDGIKNISSTPADVTFNPEDQKINRTIIFEPTTEIKLNKEKCYICKKVINQGEMQAHLHSHKLICKLCPPPNIFSDSLQRVYENQEELDDHQEQDHGCSKCKDVHSNLTDHQFSKHKFCIICRYENVDPEKHIYQCYQCKFCGKREEDSDYLRKHYQLYHDVKIKAQLLCVQCLRSFETASDMQQHLDNCYNGLECKYCYHIANNKKEMQKHKYYEHQQRVLTIENIQPPTKTTAQFTHIPNAKQAKAKEETKQPQVYECVNCQQKFDNQQDLYRHGKKEHSNNAPTTKVQTPYKPSKQANANEETKQPQIYQCKDCQQQFNNQQDLYKHGKKEHSKNASNAKAQTPQADGKQANAKANEPQVYECVVCYQQFNNQQELYRHGKKEHANNAPNAKAQTPQADGKQANAKAKEETKQPIKCQVCEKQFDNKQLLQTHINKNHVECPTCHQLLVNENGLKIHIGKMHTIWYPCNKCNYEFDNKPELQQHIKDRHSQQSIEYICPTCRDVFDSENGLKIHIGRMHTIWYPCNQCNYEFNNKPELQQHIKDRHSKQSVQYICPTCRDVFDSDNGLKIHIGRMHTIRYPCNQCNYEFSNQQELQSHIKDRHSKQSVEYKCPTCRDVFNSDNGLRIHIGRMHKTRFTCNKCDYEGESEVGLKIHTSKKHK